MTSTSKRAGNAPRFPGITVAKAWLLVGSLDICSAFIYSYIKRGTYPSTVLQSIAKAVFGKTAITNTALLNVSGLLIHFMIALGWTILFFLLYPKLKLMRQNKIVTGIVYGIFIWAMMSMVILPLWNHRPFTFNPESASIGALILVVAIGLPLSFIAHRSYSKN